MELLIIPLMGILAGYAGGSLPHSNLLDKVKATWLPEALFALTTGLIGGYVALGTPYEWVATAVISIWVYLWFQTGHANALNWGRKADPNRKNTLTPLVDWLAKRLGVKIFGRGYSFLFFGVKGLLMGGPTNAILWPLSYDIGVMTGKHWVSEVLSGAFYGLQLYVLLLILN